MRFSRSRRCSAACLDSLLLWNENCTVVKKSDIFRPQSLMLMTEARWWQKRCVASRTGLVLFSSAPLPWRISPHTPVRHATYLYMSSETYDLPTSVFWVSEIFPRSLRNLCLPRVYFSGERCKLKVAALDRWHSNRLPLFAGDHALETPRVTDSSHLPFSAPDRRRWGVNSRVRSLVSVAGELLLADRLSWQLSLSRATPPERGEHVGTVRVAVSSTEVAIAAQFSSCSLLRWWRIQWQCHSQVLGRSVSLW